MPTIDFSGKADLLKVPHTTTPTTKQQSTFFSSSNLLFKLICIGHIIFIAVCAWSSRFKFCGRLLRYFISHFQVHWYDLKQNKNAGKLSIDMKGTYTFCTTSNAGYDPVQCKQAIQSSCWWLACRSHLFVDDKDVVDSSWLHGEWERCQDTVLSEGLHSVKIEFFTHQSYGTPVIKATYRLILTVAVRAHSALFMFCLTHSQPVGPTQIVRRSLFQVQILQPRLPPVRPSGPCDCTARAYRSAECRTYQPWNLSDTALFVPLISGTLMISSRWTNDFFRHLVWSNICDFLTLLLVWVYWPKYLQFIPSMPNDNVAGEFFGKLDIVKKGSYTLCTISDDGYVSVDIGFFFGVSLLACWSTWLNVNSSSRSYLFIDGKRLVDNGGLHGAQQVCGAIVLAEGGHNVKVIQNFPLFLLQFMARDTLKDRLPGSKLEARKILKWFTGKDKIRFHLISLVLLINIWTSIQRPWYI